jgi:hypothetical protein
MPLKNSHTASSTASTRISSHSSTTAQCSSARHGVSMYRSRDLCSRLLACCVSGDEASTRAEQSGDA